MAQKIVGYVRFQVPAGKATPAPPVGPALGQYGVNIGQFTKDFNERTKGDMGMMIPVVITVYSDRSFTFITKTPPAALLIKKACGIETLEVVYSGDGVENVRDAVLAMRQRSPDMILCTGGMSVDPDDNTPGGIKAAGADIVCYGAPVLPGAMFLLGYFEDGLPVMGLPGCVMYAGATIFDLILPKVAADIPVTRSDIAALGEGGLCLGCKECHYPICPFGK